MLVTHLVWDKKTDDTWGEEVRGERGGEREFVTRLEFTPV